MNWSLIRNQPKPQEKGQEFLFIIFICLPKGIGIDKMRESVNDKQTDWHWILHKMARKKIKKIIMQCRMDVRNAFIFGLFSVHCFPMFFLSSSNHNLMMMMIMNAEWWINSFAIILLLLLEPNGRARVAKRVKALNIRYFNYSV